MNPLRPLILLPMLASCGVDFSEPLADTPAVLQVGVALSDSAPAGEARLSASLWPGYDGQGAVRTLSDSSFRVMGRTITPYTGYTTDSPSGVLYSDVWAFDPDAPLGSVEVQAPPIAGIGEAPPMLRLTPPWRAGPANLTVAPGSPLRLDLAIAAEPADTLFETWTVYLLKDGRLVAQLGAAGTTPPTIEVPWAMLSGLGDGGQVELSVHQTVTTPLTRRYGASLRLSTEHVWFVRVRP